MLIHICLHYSLRAIIKPHKADPIKVYIERTKILVPEQRLKSRNCRRTFQIINVKHSVRIQNVERLTIPL